MTSPFYGRSLFQIDINRINKNTKIMHLILPHPKIQKSKYYMSCWKRNINFSILDYYCVYARVCVCVLTVKIYKLYSYFENKNVILNYLSKSYKFEKQTYKSKK